MGYEYMSGMGTVPANYLGSGTSQIWEDFRRNMQQGPCEAPWKRKLEIPGMSENFIRAGCKGMVTGTRKSPGFGWCCPPNAFTSFDPGWFPAPSGQEALEYAKSLRQEAAAEALQDQTESTACEDRQCPSGSSLQKLEFSHLEYERSRAKQQAMTDQGCEHLCTPRGPTDSSATKHFCCPRGFDMATVRRAGLQTSTPDTPVQQEEKYFGFTTKQLMLIGAGGLVIYMLAKK